jgi:hypothetical protein
METEALLGAGREIDREVKCRGNKFTLRSRHNRSGQIIILSCVWETRDGVWIGDSIYWPLTRTTRNYK